jgi:hypothetical protein
LTMLKQVILVAVLVLAASIGFARLEPAFALTPLKSPEQLAQDDILYARASRSIEAAAMPCFPAPTARQRKPITIRFFLADAGKKVSQLQVLEPGTVSKVMRRAAFRAIRRCAPYAVPDELRNRGGFWATVTLERFLADPIQIGIPKSAAF